MIHSSNEFIQKNKRRGGDLNPRPLALQQTYMTNKPTGPQRPTNPVLFNIMDNSSNFEVKTNLAIFAIGITSPILVNLKNVISLKTLSQNSLINFKK